jgi:hypothetical protein
LSDACAKPVVFALTRAPIQIHSALDFFDLFRGRIAPMECSLSIFQFCSLSHRGDQIMTIGREQYDLRTRKDQQVS